MARKTSKFIDRKAFRGWNEIMSKRFDPELFYKSTNIFVRKFEQARIKSTVKFIEFKNNDVALDIGCGSAKLTEFSGLNNLTGIDISDHLINIAKRKMSRVIKAEGESLPFKDASFDKIVCSEVLEHVIEPEAIVKEARRCLRQNGKFIVTIPNEPNINFIKKYLGFFNLLKPNKKDSYKMPDKMDEEWHLHSFGIKKFKDIILGKFRIEEIRYLPFKIFPLRYIIRCRVDLFEGDYENELFDVLARLRNVNFFYRGRAKIAEYFIRKHALSNVPLYRRINIVDIGFGQGNQLPEGLFKNDNLIGVDININTLLKLNKRKNNVSLVNADINKLPFRDTFDLVLLFDILEHIYDDKTALDNVYAICKRGGFLAITVPALKGLYGEFDKLAYHKRRYAFNELRHKLTDAGFKIKKMSYFIMFLMPLIYLYRTFREILIKINMYSLTEIGSAMEVKTIPVINTILLYIMLLEGILLRKFSLPFGASIIVIAEK